ncbi:Nif3-like dinuclear metal center hexameric protein [Castellaniella sp.]|uniref:Nif3-like dinuclear metal center hexameric protein n=1 Tax=Castellaniella sp. TaxID=1955812 RepID=UPI00355D23DB
MAEITRVALEAWLSAQLKPDGFRDYCPNGLQVQGRDLIRHVVTGVTASQALIEAAIGQGADALLVHHGWFWKNEDPTIRGPKYRRLAAVLGAGLNLFAYHLPLDAHPEWGNNAQLARILGWQPDLDAAGLPLRCGPEGLVWLGRPAQPCTVAKLAAQVAGRLGREPLLVGEPDRPVGRLAWCTGAAQGMIEHAVAAGADCYLSGEISEPTVHWARETGCAYLAAGHHATERYGVQALGAAIETTFGVRCTFIDIDNPA